MIIVVFTLIFMLLFVYAAFFILTAVGKWCMFTKMDKPGWYALIPIVSDYVLIKHTTNDIILTYAVVILMIINTCNLTIFRGEPASFAKSFIALVTFIVTSIAYYCVAQSFGKENKAYFLGLVIVPFVFTLILGLGKATYHGPHEIYDMPWHEYMRFKDVKATETSTSNDQN